jgi:hypothetical protein
MAGDNQGQRVFGQGIADGPAGGGPAYSFCQSPVARCLAELYLPAGHQNGSAESAESIQQDGDVRAEIYTRAFEVCGYLLLKYLEKSLVALGGREIS